MFGKRELRLVRSALNAFNDVLTACVDIVFVEGVLRTTSLPEFSLRYCLVLLSSVGIVSWFNNRRRLFGLARAGTDIVCVLDGLKLFIVRSIDISIDIPSIASIESS